MKTRSVVALCFALMVPFLSSGCGETTTAQTGEFAPGAFPPTLSDEEYHQDAWTRTDCLVCHEEGMQDSPLVKHVSLPDLAVKVKCRTCHVLIPGSKPRQ